MKHKKRPMIERYGFLDSNLKNPVYDFILCNCLDRQFLFDIFIDLSFFIYYKKSKFCVTSTPEYDLNRLNMKIRNTFRDIQLEKPLLFHSFVFGFIDVFVRLNEFQQQRDNIINDFYYNDFLCKSNHNFFIKIEPKITSVGELVRQINMYRTYGFDDDIWIVITKSKGFKDILKSQNIYVYELEDIDEQQQKIIKPD